MESIVLTILLSVMLSLGFYLFYRVDKTFTASMSTDDGFELMCYLDKDKATSLTETIALLYTRFNYNIRDVHLKQLNNIIYLKVVCDTTHTRSEIRELVRTYQLHKPTPIRVSLG